MKNKIHEAIRLAMEESGISSARVAENSKLSASQLSQFLNGRFLERSESGRLKGSNLSSNSVDELLETCCRLNPAFERTFVKYLSGDFSNTTREEMAKNLLEIAERIKQGDY